MLADDIHKQFIYDIENASAWRGQKAEEDPEDIRHRRSCEALEALAKYVRNLRIDHAMFRALDALAQTEGSAADSLSLEVRVVIIDQELGRYGFDVPVAGDADHEQFLQRLASEIRGVIRRYRVTIP